MADYIFIRKTRNVASSAAHVFLNLLLGVGSVLITVLSNSPLLGLILILVSKWRIFAVRPRFFMINLKSNLVDIIVGASVVILAYFSGATILPVDFMLAGFYCIWLLFIKPLSSERATLIQALTAIFIGMSAASIMSANMDSIVLVTMAFIVGYGASRHVLVQGGNRDFSLATMICGLVFAEIAWLCHSWLIIYTYGSTGIRIPQLAIILTVTAFIYNNTRQTIIRLQDDLRFKDIIAPMIFGVILIGIIVIWFSNPAFNI